MKLFNIKKLKFYETKTGNYYLPKYAYKDIIRNSIINDAIFDDHIYQLSREYIKPNSIVLDLGSNFGQLGILFSKVQKNVDVYCFEASKYIFETNNYLLKSIGYYKSWKISKNQYNSLYKFE